MKNKIIIKGAKENNLKNINIELPRDKMIVMTGISGSGKTSLAFDTIYAEGQRRYLESLSSYARQFLGQMEKPDIESIEGLSPTISIDQKQGRRNPRSTVGTVTEIYDYLRLLYARIGDVFCPNCNAKISKQTISQMVDKVMALKKGKEKIKLMILAPLVRGRKGEYIKLFEKLKRDGYVRVRADGEMMEISEPIVLDKNKKHTIEVVIDRLILKEGLERRLADSFEIALKLGEGIAIVFIVDGEEMLFSENFACLKCGATIVRKIGLKALEHTYLPGERKGKPYAIRYALEQINDYETRYDGICIYDADNLVSLNSLQEMNKHLSVGQQLVQCYLDTKNPMDNWISLSFAANFYYMNRSYQLSRTHSKLGASLGGTGFCIGTKLLKKIGWTANSLTEDLEFQIQTVLGDEKAHWCHTARVYDEKPTSFKASCEQRSRWARGHWELIFKFAPTLLIKAIKEKSIVALDTLFYSLNPLHMLVGGIMIIFGLVSIIVHYPLKGLIPIHPIIWNILIVMTYILIIFSIIQDVHKPKLKLLGAITIPIFNLTYVPIVFWALLTRKNKIWKRTEHSKNVTLDLELNSIKVKNKN